MLFECNKGEPVKNLTGFLIMKFFPRVRGLFGLCPISILLPVPGYGLYTRGDGKIAVIIDDCPGGLRARVNAIGAKAIAQLPRALHELCGASEIYVHGIDPVAASIPGRDARAPIAEALTRGLLVETHRKHVGVSLFASEVSHAPQG
jgi:hypothetical protein